MKSPKEMIEEIIQAGLRQQDIANSVGMAKSHVSELRSGRRGNMVLKKYEKLAEYHKKVMQRWAREQRKLKASQAEPV